MTKPFDTKELLARITVQLRKAEQHGETKSLSVGDLVLDMVSLSLTVQEQPVKLTRTEYAILKLLMENPKQVISKSVLLDRISLDTPDFLVLDEPVNGLDPQGIVEMRELILKLNREKQITVLISSHILDELSRLATHYGIIDNGRMVKELSAEELDTVCRKCVRMEVTDTSTLARVLDSMNLEYKIISATTADVFAKINVTQLTVVLAKENCEVLSMQEKDESLESYYISLVGGDNNA